jgi:hypothetical protein
LTLLMFALSFGTNVSYAAQPAHDVNVVNTPNVNVTNQPTVSLAPGSNVGISGNPGVTVTNPSTSPVPFKDTDNPARHPFAASCVGTLTAGDIAGSCQITATAAGTTVLEVVTLEAIDVPPGQGAFAQVTVTTNGVQNDFALPLSTPSGGNVIVAAFPPIRLYADAGTTIVLGFIRNRSSTTGGGILEFAVSGYFIAP